MEVQSLSICVPAGCPNDCKFCVSKMHRDTRYKNLIGIIPHDQCLEKLWYVNRMAFARDNGCNTVILTGDGEPTYNMDFIRKFDTWNNELDRPFRWIELQTCGVNLDNKKLGLLRGYDVSTISLSLSSVYDDEKNAEYNGTKPEDMVHIEELCHRIKEFGFNLRLSLNMTDEFNSLTPYELFLRAKELGANQITFRILYTSEKGSEQNKWITEHRALDFPIESLKFAITSKGKLLERLPFGGLRYAVEGMSVVVDDDCMNQQAKEAIKYLILRPDCRLYTKWEEPGSLLF